MPASATFDLPRLEQHTLRSSEGREYRIVVARPSAPPPPAGYPVIYVLDGNAWTGIIAEVVRVNQLWAQQGQVEPTVVVGIGYPTQEAFDIERRFYDLTTPWSDSPMLRAFGWSHYKLGGADTFFEFIQRTLKPDIEREFQIDRGRQTLFGHSLGGLFTLRTLLVHPDAFRSYIALSPAIFWNDHALLEDEEQFRAKYAGSAAARTGLRVFVGVGDLEQHPRQVDMDRMRQQFAKLAQVNGSDADTHFRDLMQVNKDARWVDNAREISARLAKLGITTQFVNFLEEDHFSVLPAAISRSLPFVLR